jgi:hypothetical protein
VFPRVSARTRPQCSAVIPLPKIHRALVILCAADLGWTVNDSKFAFMHSLLLCASLAHIPPWLLWSLPGDWSHVFVDHLEVARLEITEISPYNEHVAGVAERKVRPIFEADAEIQRSVLDGMGYEVHDFAVNLGISPPKSFVLLLYALVDSPAFFGAPSNTYPFFDSFRSPDQPPEGSLVHLDILLEANYSHLGCLLKKKNNESNCCGALWTC